MGPQAAPNPRAPRCSLRARVHGHVSQAAPAVVQPGFVLHGPGMLRSPGHVGAKLQAFAAHVTSHEQAKLQSTTSHEVVPSQVTLHGPWLHVTKWQEWDPLQCSVQSPVHASVWQRSMPPSQVMSQGPLLQSNLFS